MKEEEGLIFELENPAMTSDEIAARLNHEVIVKHSGNGCIIEVFRREPKVVRECEGSPTITLHKKPLQKLARGFATLRTRNKHRE